MAMVKCDECGKDISDKAPACVNCGAPAATTEPAANVEAASPSVFTGIADLNGDGKIDYEDLKTAMFPRVDH